MLNIARGVRIYQEVKMKRRRMMRTRLGDILDRDLYDNEGTTVLIQIKCPCCNELFELQVIDNVERVYSCRIDCSTRLAGGQYTKGVSTPLTPFH